VFHVAQLGALVVVENCPAAQVAQVRSAVALPGVDTYCPAPHVFHVAQLGALVVVENCPAAQAAHVRSAFALPGAETYCPALQLLKLEQFLAPGAGA
jgi:hypothetical protein